ncbi:MAG: HAD-IA family hydrolase [Thiobacillaceae bacterium]|nr:HAD-IA family hydrolase [Thiobacillaceae bacterium]MCX7673742.1 HAD-IA family hydrolase [Thiobacillaceae bacterium]MDW8324506.1 HAD-IA family hydrolase [Burkholderiales bacterium]
MAERRYELIIFDWDGTLMDSAGTIVACIQAACAELDLPVPSREAASHIIGLGLNDALRQLLPELPQADYPRLVEAYRRHYLARDADIPLFAGAAELVQALNTRGHLLAVATGKARRGLERAFRHTGLGAFFHASRTADETHSKPHPAMIEELLAELAVPRGRALMVGDTSHDLEMARNAGVAALAAGYGAHPADSLARYQPLAVCASFAELSQWLLENA